MEDGKKFMSHGSLRCEGIDGTYSVEIPTKFSFVIEFIIPKFIEGST
jgi:hypothetical protein